MKTHILLIDDDSDELEIFCDALDEVHIEYKCTWAKGAAHALQMMEFIVPDIIFIDYNMPRMNGVQGIRMIRSKEQLKNVPIVLYSNFISEGNRHEAIQLGATACIQKPYNMENLTMVLSRFFKLSFTLKESMNREEYPDSSIEEMMLSDAFKKAASDHGYTHLQQFLQMPITTLFDTDWVTIDMIEEIAAMVKKYSSAKNNFTLKNSAWKN